MAESDFPIVGIGASAGGVEALSALFTHIPPHPGAAFIVVTHLASNRISLLPEILGRCTSMPVASAADGLAIEKDHVYLIPPGAILTVAGLRLALSDRLEERNPIDIMLASLAVEAGERAIAVILSGTGTDGAVGVKSVREAGGFTLAQGADTKPQTHHGMPDAAIATGFVDCVLPVDELAARLAGYIAATRAAPDGGALGAASGATLAASDAVDAVRKDLYDLLRDRVGHDFSGYKKSTFLRRLERRMHVRHIAGPADYLVLVRAEPGELDLLFRDLLIGVTMFFRDMASFDELVALVVPRLFEGKGQGDTIRVWVPGCATGEEAYSIAILLSEHVARETPRVRLQVFATDVDENALAVARAGRYPAKLLEGMSPERLGRFFVREGKSYAVGKEIREICLFSCHSIIRDPPFSHIDLISCRNLLIYFTLELQNKVIPLFHYALRPGGFLFLGPSEHASQHERLFAPLDKKHRIFQRRDVASRPTIFPGFTSSGTIARLARGEPDGAAPGGQDVVRAAQLRVLDRYAPAHVVVNGDGDVVHYSGRTGRYLEPPAGAPSRNLTALARKGLGLPLRSALHEAAQSRRPAERARILVETDGGLQAIDLTVEPLADIGDGTFRLIVFTDVGTVPSRDATAAADRPGERDAAFLQMDQELHQTRERLQTAIEEYETSVEELKSSNEEMLSVNEELQSANEELETSKEELQSVNEELHTVNSELETKVAELDRANSDLRNFFESTRIATIFLDENLIIRSFTPAVTDVFKLLASDCGRSLLDFVTYLDYDSLAADVHAALQVPAPFEKRLVSRDGQSHYLMRILPYRTSGGGTDGVVVTFINVTFMVQFGEQQALVAELNHRVKNVLAVVSSIATRMARRGGTLEDFVAKFTDRLGGLARTHDILSVNQWSHVGLDDLVQGELNAFADRERFAAHGPQVLLRPPAATTLGIVIHELATNAAKYGAFANDHGLLDISWMFETRQGQKWLVLTWRESGGPPVQPPTHKGFGTDVIERSADYQFGGTTAIDFLPDGVVATLAMPASEVIHDPDHAVRGATPAPGATHPPGRG